MGEDVGQKLPDVLEDRAPFLDGVDDAREIVVQQHHVGGLLRHVRARDPHGDPDVGALERGRVVHAVARDRHDVALLFRASTMRSFWSAATRAKMTSDVSSSRHQLDLGR